MPSVPVSTLDQMRIVDYDCSEELSVSSTFNVTAEEPIIKAPPSFPSRKRSVRNISFNESANVHYANHQICREDVDSLWYSRMDLQEFKNNYVEAIKEVIRAERDHKKDSKSYQRVFTRVFDACCRATKEHDVDQIMSTYSALRSRDRYAFEEWVAVATTRTGLERVAHRKICQDRATRRRQLFDAVQSWQDAAVAYNSTTSIDNNINNNIENIIALAAQELSRPSRVFATYLGQAQARALQR
ncbi:hypothetical protein ACA910_008966 [Epithemia clementina (nom. ined.)]